MFRFNQTMSVSVVVPTFNRAGLIAATLETIINQTHSALQIIVVDDGSSDNTQEIIKRVNHDVNFIKIENSGDLVARNVGLQAATGKLVAFCDSDDLWAPDHLSEMLRFWGEGDGPICAYSDFKEVRNGLWADRSKFDAAPSGYWEGLVSVGADRALMTGDIVSRLLQFQLFFTSCLVVDRARFLALGGWDEGVSRMIGCDFATALRVAEHPPVGVLRRATVGIRKHASNISGDVLRMNLGDAAVLEHVLATRPSLSNHAVAIRHSITARRLAAFDTAFAQGDFNAARATSQKLPSTALTPRHRVKAMISDLPAPIRRLAWSILTRNN
jgi:glycosyltransferase involved in cell wall biosynthesis